MRRSGFTRRDSSPSLRDTSGLPTGASSRRSARAERGLIDADLGGGLIKQRVARAGEGRSGGYRTLIACRFGDFAVFLFGFAKSERDNIRDELRELRAIARQWLADRWKIEKDAAAGVLIEVRHDDFH